MITKLCATAALILCAGMAQALPMLNASGATSVDVGGTLYDVSFVDGSCAALFDGCDEDTVFTFTNADDAIAAANALLGVINATPSVDMNPENINGCSSTLACSILTPYGSDGTSFLVSSLVNADNDASDHVGTGETLIFFDFSNEAVDSGQVVLARWVLSDVSPVPLPATAPLMLFGLAGLAALSRRWNRKTG